MSEQTTDVMGVLSKGEWDALGDWEVILEGDDKRRPSWLKKLARTSVELTLPSEDHFKTFLSALKASSEKLQQIPDSEVKYVWERAARNGLSIRFGVAWYDKDFFEARKNAFMSDEHGRMFETFGITAKDLKVSHQIIG